MNPAPTISTALLEHPSMDYALLRQAGMRHLERMAGQLWTDFNVHDPGITILEQVCYAITDLGYRIAYDLPDLLAGNGVEPSCSLFSPAQILPSHPVTLTDLRKLVLDVDGVKNAWIEHVTDSHPYLPLDFAADTRELRLHGEERTASPVALKGLYRVLVAITVAQSAVTCRLHAHRALWEDLAEIRTLDTQRMRVQSAVTRRLHAHRALCEDFAKIRVLDTQYIRVQACIEIEAVEDAERLWLEIYQRIAAYISPPVRFYTLSELRAAGKPIDEIFEGPLLEHGFIESADLVQTSTRRTELHTSDLIREIMAVDGVRAVRTISLTADRNTHPWSLTLDLARAPALDVWDEDICLERNGLPVRVDASRLLTEAAQAQEQAHSDASHARRRAARDLPPPAGRDRSVGTYYALQHQFPAVYGIGAMGLPASATPQRQAQAKQLKAYLMFFDQLLANYFAQLAHVKDLLAFSGNTVHTYVAHMLDDPTLGVDGIRVQQDPKRHRTTLQELIEDEPTALRRRHRFLNHLLARFAEQFADYALILYGMSQEDSTTAKKLLQDKQTFLQHYPYISSARGTGHNMLALRGPDNNAGLAQRLRLKLGIEEQHGEALYLVEHILLRPLQDDRSQQVPVLAQARQPDPYSLQLSVVLPDDPPPHVKAFIEQTIREETPAHLLLSMHWLSKEAMTRFVTAYTDWLDARQRYGTEPPHIQMRDARDRLLDLLGLGQTYPLQDLPVRAEQPLVALDTAARIAIAHSQQGVWYQLHETDNTPVTRTPTGEKGGGVPVEAEGNGDTLVLETYRLQEGATFKIHARKSQPGSQAERAAYLHQTVTVNVGLDVTLQAVIRDPAIMDAPPLIPYGTSVEVDIYHSQEGVEYRLVAATAPEQEAEEEISVASVRGNRDTITLRTQPLFEDTDLHIRATRVFGAAEHRESVTDLLQIVLPINVRANPALQVAVASAIIDFQQAATVTIAETQRSVSYQIFMRPIPDRDFVYPPDPASEVLIVPVAGKPDVQVRKPACGDVWATPPGYTAASAPQPGTGGALACTIPALTDDSLLIVQASKEHQAAPSVSSAIQLEQAAVILVRPNPAPALRLVPVEPAATSGAFQVFDGQPGVFYYFRREPEGTELGLPVYFHKKDETYPAVNKGIDQLRIGVDFVIAPTLPADRVQASVSLAEVPPAAPILETGALPVGTVCSVRAVKAQTGVEVELAQPILLGP